MKRYLLHHYRDLTALVYLLAFYPQVLAAGHDSGDAGWITIPWLLFGVVGVAATMIKLRSLDPKIAENKLETEVKATAQRFLAGFIALPLMITTPLFMMLGEAAAESWLGPVHLGIGVVVWILLLRYGRGKNTIGTTRLLARVATIALVLFEMHLYTLFLESLAMADEGFSITMRSLLVLLLPMTGLFFLLFLPATIGFYVEETVRYRSHGVALVMLWLKFAGYRFLPVYLISYLEGRGVRVPWVF